MIDEYPTDDELEKIETWTPVDDLHGLMAYIKPLWKYSDCGYWTQEGDVYNISTGGWSGNEDIITAMKCNIIFWMMFWQQSQRGGHFVFMSSRTWVELNG